MGALTFRPECTIIVVMTNAPSEPGIPVVIDGKAGFLMGQKCTSKDEALTSACPQCNAAPGERCVEADGVTWRKSCHGSRHDAAIAAGARIRFINGSRVRYVDELAERSQAAA